MSTETATPDLAPQAAEADAATSAASAAAIAELMAGMPDEPYVPPTQEPAAPPEGTPAPEAPPAAPETPPAAAPTSAPEAPVTQEQYLARLNEADRQRREYEVENARLREQIQGGTIAQLREAVSRDPSVLRRVFSDADQIALASALLAGQQPPAPPLPPEVQSVVQQMQAQLEAQGRELRQLNSTRQLEQIQGRIAGKEQWLGINRPERLSEFRDAYAALQAAGDSRTVEQIADFAAEHYYGVDSGELERMLAQPRLAAKARELLGSAAPAAAAAPPAAPAPVAPARPVAAPAASANPPKTPEEMTEDERRKYAIAICEGKVQI